MTYLEDTEYTKFDGSETFKAQTFFRKFLISCGKFKYRRNDIPVYSPAFHCIRSFFDVFCRLDVILRQKAFYYFSFALWHFHFVWGNFVFCTTRLTENSNFCFGISVLQHILFVLLTKKKLAINCSFN